MSDIPITDDSKETPLSSVPPEPLLPGDSTPLTDLQKIKMEAITRAIEVLDDAHVPFSFYASPDDPAEGMKVVQAQRLSYSDPKDLKSVLADTVAARRAIHWSVMKTMSQGLSGGIAVYGADGSPIVLFQKGKSLAVKKEDKEPKVVV